MAHKLKVNHLYRHQQESQVDQKDLIRVIFQLDHHNHHYHRLDQNYLLFHLYQSLTTLYYQVGMHLVYRLHRHYRHLGPVRQQFHHRRYLFLNSDLVGKHPAHH